MERLLKAIKESKHLVALTGAGISTLSGVSDFRGKNGLYKQNSIEADNIFSLSYFLKDPSYYYLKTKDFIYNVHEKIPCVVHRVLAELERKNILKSVITQNIDMLHQKAGSRNVIEIHGSPAVHKCLRCAKSFPYDEIRTILEEGKIPHCPDCGGIIKPEIIFFGENLNERALSNAVSEALKADLMLVLGSTLVVQPAASLPLYTIKNSGRIVIINNMETPLDDMALLRYSDLEKSFNYLDGCFF
ncbi:MAG: NAD-dependent deacetylase [Lentisphaerae bacterium GWF2_45_14]|nr:MAG: NAD-dependent deacetylase [Lentisphaerae bacterium GWF2_45_14]